MLKNTTFYSSQHAKIIAFLYKDQVQNILELYKTY